MKSLLLVVLGIVGASRVIELVVSRRRARGRGGALAEPWWPAIVTLHASLLVGTLILVVRAKQPPPAIAIAIALSMIVVASLLRVWIHATLGACWNARVVVDPSRDVVTHGPYRFVRHPNYLAVILEVAALPMLAGAWTLAIVASLINASLLRRRIRFEERELCLHHPHYREVMMARPRFLPRVSPQWAQPLSDRKSPQASK
jgi:methyltransferase